MSAALYGQFLRATERFYQFIALILIPLQDIITIIGIYWSLNGLCCYCTDSHAFHNSFEQVAVDRLLIWAIQGFSLDV